MNNSEIALAELIERNPIRNDGDAYELQLALWGIGLIDDRPDPEAFGQQVTDDFANMEYAESQAEVS